MGAVESGWVINTNRLEVSLADTRAGPNTGMVLMEVELLTGWRAVSPERLTNQVEALVHGDQASRTVRLRYDSNYCYQSLVD